MTADDDAPAGLIASRYRIVREIGRGATSVVYAATDTTTERAVALKMLRSDLVDPRSIDAFLREIHLHQRLDHPRVLPLLDSGRTDGRLFLVVPFMAGGTLRQRLHAQAQLPFAEAIAIARDVAEALASAHVVGLIHRDVKPENVLFDDVGRAHLGDFGIARALEHSTGEGSTSAGLVRGTPMYMSPEQAAGQLRYDGRSDLYSLGCMLYEMISGVGPFHGPTPQSVMAQRLTHAPEPLTRFRPSTPSALATVVERVLVMTPADRYQTAEAMIADLDAARTALDTPSRSQPAVRRRRVTGIAVLAGTAILAAVAFLAIPRGSVGARDDLAIPPGDPRRIAVLYFDSRTPEVLPAYIADGLTEDLIDELGRVRALHVTSPTGVRSFRAGAPTIASIARTLQVGTIVTGSVARSGDRLRIAVRLVDAATGQQVDSRELEENWSELFALQDRLTEQVQFWLRQRIGDVIGARVNRAGTRSVEAWELVQRATSETRRASLLPGRNRDTSVTALFLAADSLYARAALVDRHWSLPPLRRADLALLAMALRSHRHPPGVDSSRYAAMSRTEQRLAWTLRAEALADSVARTSPRNALALTIRAQARATLAVPGAPGSEQTIRAAISDLHISTADRPDLAAPWVALAEVYLQVGEFEPAADAARRAYEADEFFEMRRVTDIAFNASLWAERFDDARQLCREALQHYPGDPRFTECELRLLGSAGGDEAEIDTAWRRLHEIEAADSIGMLSDTWGFRRLMIAAALARAGRADSARRLLQRVTAEQPELARRGSHLAECYVLALLADRDGAVTCLDSLSRSRPAPRLPVHRLPWFRPLWGDPRLDRSTGDGAAVTRGAR